MQLNEDNDEDEEDQPQNLFHQKNFYKDNRKQPKDNRNYSKNDYVDSEREDSAEEEENQDESDQEEPNNFANMQSKFQPDLKPATEIGALNMFDDDISQDKHSVAELKNPKMEPIEEGYSSEESFGAQQRHKNFQQNMKQIMKEKIGKEGSDPKNARNHINLRTSQTDNKENVNNKNDELKPKSVMPNTIAAGSSTLKRPATAKMRTTNTIKNTYARPQTAKPKASKKRPSTGLSTKSGFGTQKGLKTKMMKKSDPVSRYQAMQNSWTKNKFLSQHKGTKQGRKLDLCGFNQWARMVQSSNQKPVVKQIHRYINQNMPLASNKRDDLRFHLRAKMSQEDYVDATMKHFHYNPVK